MGSPRANALLGDAYSKGIGVPYNHQKSIDNFYKAALEGDPSAQFILAELLEIFPDILKNTTTEHLEEEFYLPSYWYARAAEAGITDSESAYQRLYLP